MSSSRRLTYKGGGAIYLHLAPLAFSNFFLLHKQNTGTVVTVLLVLAFNAIMLILLELPLLGYAFAPDWTAATIERFSNWLIRRGGRVALIAGAIAGVLLILRGIVNW